MKHIFLLIYFSPQITVRSSPINNNNSRSDSISICRQCHKFCSKKKMKNSISNDSNNNQLNRNSKGDTSCDSSSTLKDITEDTSTEEIKEMRASQTMMALQSKSPINESPLKTSTSSPSALQTGAAKKESKGVRIKLNSSPTASPRSIKIANGVCNCECKPRDFEKTTISPDEVKHEIVKILSDIDQIPSKVSITDSSSRSSDSPYLSYSSTRARTLQSKYSFLYNNNHMTAAAKHQPVNIIKETMIGAQEKPSSTTMEATAVVTSSSSVIEQKTAIINTSTTTTIVSALSTITSLTKDDGGNDENFSLDLAAQSDPITISVSSVPAISILPPTPDLKKQHSFNQATTNLEITKVNSISIKTESSFDSVDDDEEEPPYVKLKTSLKKYGTMSSLERLPSEDTDEKTLDSSGEDSGDEELKVVSSGDQSFRTWTSRAGSFLEESRAFIDKYLGREGHGSAEYVFLKSNSKDGTDFDEYETIEGETSQSASGEEVWGTPTSGGENDEIHMFNNGDGHQTVRNLTFFKFKN